jgi:hypothetical protein
MSEHARKICLRFGEPARLGVDVWISDPGEGCRDILTADPDFRLRLVPGLLLCRVQQCRGGYDDERYDRDPLAPPDDGDVVG